MASKQLFTHKWNEKNTSNEKQKHSCSNKKNVLTLNKLQLHTSTIVDCNKTIQS